MPDILLKKIRIYFFLHGDVVVSFKLYQILHHMSNLQCVSITCSVPRHYLSQSGTSLLKIYPPFSIHELSRFILLLWNWQCITQLFVERSCTHALKRFVQGNYRYTLHPKINANDSQVILFVVWTTDRFTRILQVYFPSATRVVLGKVYILMDHIYLLETHHMTTIK